METDYPDNDCGNDFDWWWQTVGMVDAEERRVSEANEMLRIIADEEHDEKPTDTV